MPVVRSADEPGHRLASETIRERPVLSLDQMGPRAAAQAPDKGPPNRSNGEGAPICRAEDRPPFSGVVLTVPYRHNTVSVALYIMVLENRRALGYPGIGI